MNTKTILKTTGQQVYPLEYIGQGVAPWPADYQRVMIPNPHGKNHIQIVRKSKLRTINTGFGGEQ